MEHNPWDMAALQDSLQYLLNRKQIAASGSLAPSVTPIVRIPANGVEMNQAYAKQALDRGVYGVIWPHINDVAQAYNAVASCRYGRPKNAPLYEPRGVRGDGAGDGGALLGTVDGGVLREGRRLAAGAARRTPGRSDDRERRGHREPRRNPQGSARHRLRV
jgi:hypothetical protein